LESGERNTLRRGTSRRDASVTSRRGMKGLPSKKASPCRNRSCTWCRSSACRAPRTSMRTYRSVSARRASISVRARTWSSTRSRSPGRRSRELNRTSGCRRSERSGRQRASALASGLFPTQDGPVRITSRPVATIRCSSPRRGRLPAVDRRVAALLLVPRAPILRVTRAHAPRLLGEEPHPRRPRENLELVSTPIDEAAQCADRAPIPVALIGQRGREHDAVVVPPQQIAQAIDRLAASAQLSVPQRPEQVDVVPVILHHLAPLVKILR